MMSCRPFLRLGLATLLASLLHGCAEKLYADVDNDALQRLLAEGVTLVDIRTPREWAQTGVVPGSHRITFFHENGGVNPAFLPELQQVMSGTGQPVAVICRTGNRTQTLARILTEELGYGTVYNVRDGITRWISAGLPTVR
jgi:rhodanese-related sulfurtransferase